MSQSAELQGSFILTKSMVFVPDARTLDMMEGLEHISPSFKTPPPSPKGGVSEEGSIHYEKLVESIEALNH